MESRIVALTGYHVSGGVSMCCGKSREAGALCKRLQHSSGGGGGKGVSSSKQSQQGVSWSSSVMQSSACDMCPKRVPQPMQVQRTRNFNTANSLRSAHMAA